MKYAALLVFLTPPIAALAQQDIGTICGTVENELGQPAANIKVVAMPAVVGGIVPWFKTDAAGHYCAIHLIVQQTYQLTADDLDAGYPPMYDGLYSQQPLPDLELTFKHSQTTFNWRIPYKAARFHLRAMDAITGNPPRSIHYSLVLKSSPAIGRVTASGPADMQILLPPDTDLLLKVEAPGYWQWPANETPGYVINAGSLTEVNLDVPLQPHQD